MILVIFMMAATAPARAAEVNLKNGDKLTGKIVSDDEERLVLETEAMGPVTIDKAHIKEYKTDVGNGHARSLPPAEIQAEQNDPDIDWTRKASLSYSQKGGNDEQVSGSGDIFINRKTADDEATFKASAYIDTEDSKTDTRRYHGLVRYANSFGAEKKWFQFGKVEGSKDTTANIDYRVTPSYGAGYWFADREDFKLRADGAFGWEYTNYVDATKSEGEAVFTPTGHLEKIFGNGLAFVQDIALYPSLEELGEYRLRSESGLTGKIIDPLAWKFSFIDDFDSDPSGGKKKNDYQFLTGLEYSF